MGYFSDFIIKISLVSTLKGSVCYPQFVVSYSLLSFTDLSNIFESFLPQLLAYPNPIDPLNGDAAAMYLHKPDEYKQKIRGLLQNSGPNDGY